MASVIPQAIYRIGFNQLAMRKYEMGIDTNKEIMIHFRKSDEMIIRMLPNLAPANFRKPISLVFCSMVNPVRPISPSIEISNPMNVKNRMILRICLSSSYKFAMLSSRKLMLH
jgi:hypothetical protein